MLWESFGSAYAVCEGGPDQANIGPDMLAAYLAANPHIRAVSSHKARPPLPWRRALPIVMLRHPADRALSAWRYARGNAATPDHAVARSASFADYLRWSLATRGPGAVLRNHQVLHLSAGAFRSEDEEGWPATAGDLEQVKRLLRHWPAFGLVRRFGESCRLFNTRYRPVFPAFRMVDTVENASGHPGLSNEAALAEVRARLGPAMFASLCEANLLDLDLYTFAERMFERRMAALEGPGARIGWRLALQAGRIRQRVLEPGLYRRRNAGAPEALEPTRL